MYFTSAISESPNAVRAINLVCNQVRDQLSTASCHLACLFVSSIYRVQWDSVLKQLHESLGPKALIGCSGSGMIGAGQEVEQAPGVSLLAAHLPDVRLFPFFVSEQELEDSSAGGFWVDKIGAFPDAQPNFVLFADPATSDPMKLIGELNSTYRGRPIIGGLVSG